MLLQEARDRIEGAGAGMGIFGPFGLSLAGGADGGVDIGGRGLRNLRQNLAGRGVFRGEGLAGGGELAVDEMAEPVAHINEPSQRLGRAFRSGAIIHRVEDFLDGHALIQSGGATRRNRRR